MGEVLARNLTWDDIKDLPEDAGRTEIVDGELIVSPVPGLRHQKIASRLGAALLRFVESCDLGEFFSNPVHVILDKHVNFEPDLCFISKDRLSICGEATVNGAPDLIIEIVSASNRKHDEVTKFAYYAKYGVRESWLVDPREETVRVFALEAEQYQLLGSFGAGGQLESRVLHGLGLDPARIFD